MGFSRRKDAGAKARGSRLLRDFRPGSGSGQTPTAAHVSSAPVGRCPHHVRPRTRGKCVKGRVSLLARGGHSAVPVEVLIHRSDDVVPVRPFLLVVAAEEIDDLLTTPLTQDCVDSLAANSSRALSQDSTEFRVNRGGKPHRWSWELG